MKKVRKFLLVAILSLMGLCLLLIAISVLSNQGLPQQSTVVETLSNADKVRLSETLHLRQTVGDEVWPGWGQADIPAIVYNESYAFLVGYPQPPDGWIKVPADIKRGGYWEMVSGDEVFGQPYYAQPLPDSDVTPEAFTVKVGQRWVASIQTLDWAKICLMQTIRQDLPSFLRPIFPYRLFIGQLIGSSEKYISLSAHESFHAYQGILAPEKFAVAENTNIQFESQYPWNNETLAVDWQVELDLLAEVLQTADQARTLELVRQFLELRATRRESANLSPELVAYEQQREWLEGLARYAELKVWGQAASSNYNPIPETNTLTDFNGYAQYDARWSQEVNQISRMADDEGDGRFYYSGMAQAVLLDRLMPDWKKQAFETNIWLEDLLDTAVVSSP